MHKKLFMVIITIFLSISLMGIAFSARKSKPCKELKKERCIQRKDCKWTKKHERKNGKVVKGHCKCKKGKCPK